MQQKLHDGYEPRASTSAARVSQFCSSNAGSSAYPMKVNDQNMAYNKADE